ncbi:Protein of uncharacterised function (DUF3085) [Klebsiella pneumoniae]|uniref:Protein of uncharacterized function (DUF3085) n=1 Tax=Klebsiella pneumoniae TaxID=573 RepID=A0A2X3DI81_KLEPN|nr:Protein of uncharacterised function (DUF3085) [Klebsiella pneumoniae]
MLHFDPEALRLVVAEVKANQCELALAKDDGVYLISAVAERGDTGRVKHIAYADGCNPEKDDAWYETSRVLVGGDDFCEHLLLTDESIERILSDGFELWIHVLHDQIHMHASPVIWVPVAEYRHIINRMQRLAHVHYRACVGNAEYKRWRVSAIDLLATASHTDAKRAKPDDREEFLSMFERLYHLADTVNAEGALRFPAR